MRALVVHPGPQFSVSDVHRGWVKGLKNLSVETYEYNLHHRLWFFAEALLDREGEVTHAMTWQEACHLAMREIEAACYEAWPDVVIIISGFYLNEFVCRVMRDRGHKVVLIHTESPYEDSRQLPRAGWVDMNVLNDPTNIDEFRKQAPTIYMPHAYDPDIHHPQPARADMASDFAFVGTGFQSRVEFFEKVEWDGIDTKLAGNWQDLDTDSPLRPLLVHGEGECCELDDTMALYASTKMSANLYRREATHPELTEGWAMGPREVELAACGTFFLRDPRGEGDEVFPMLPTFDSPGDFSEQLRWYLNRPELRAELASQAREAIVDRTFTNHAADLLNLL